MNIRQNLKKHLHSANIKWGSKNSFVFGIEDIESVRKMNGRNGQANKNLREPLKDEFLYIDLVFFSLASLFMICQNNEGKGRTILRKGYPSNDFIFANFIANILNYAFTVEYLCLQGLDTQARTILRSLCESCFQTLILFSFPEDYKEYSAAQDNDQAQQAWFKLWSRKKIYSKLQQIEAQLGFSINMQEELRKSRENSQSFLSQSVHNSYVAVNMGAYAFSFRNNKAYPLLFGSENRLCIATMRHLCYQMFHFCLCLDAVLTKFHEWKPDNTDYWEYGYFVSNYAIAPGFMDISKNFSAQEKIV